MTDQEKAINEALNAIIDEIAKWQNRKATTLKDSERIQREYGFLEGLRLSGAIVRARLISDDIEDEADDE
jgi:hypothetical protein